MLYRWWELVIREWSSLDKEGNERRYDTHSVLQGKAVVSSVSSKVRKCKLLSIETNHCRETTNHEMRRENVRNGSIFNLLFCAVLILGPIGRIIIVRAT